MWLLLIISLGLLGWLSVWLGFIPPPHAGTVIKVNKGLLQIKKGRLKPHAREHVTDILSEAQINNGFIAITSANRVFFSRQIPAGYRQRLRNVLLNQWQ